MTLSSRDKQQDMAGACQDSFGWLSFCFLGFICHATECCVCLLRRWWTTRTMGAATVLQSHSNLPICFLHLRDTVDTSRDWAAACPQRHVRYVTIALSRLELACAPHCTCVRARIAGVNQHYEHRSDHCTFVMKCTAYMKHT